MTIKVTLFDAYGTLLDVNSATARLVASNRFPKLRDKSDTLSQIWRLRQLHYSWLRSLSGDIVSFWQCTCDALDFALAETGLAGDDHLREALLLLYRSLSAYDDASGLLEMMGKAGLPRAILSNGNHEMVQEAAFAAGLMPLLDAVLSAQDAGIFKPAPAVYQLGCAHFNVAPDEVLFFSSNGWDIAGARAFGYQTIWVNRQNQTTERLGDGPHHIVQNLDEACDLAKSLLG